MSVRESIAIGLDADVLRELDALARVAGGSRHDVVRVALKVGLALLRREREGATDQLTLPPTGGR